MQYIDVREEGKENVFSLGFFFFIGLEVSIEVIKGGGELSYRQILFIRIELEELLFVENFEKYFLQSF